MGAKTFVKAIFYFITLVAIILLLLIVFSPRLFVKGNDAKIFIVSRDWTIGVISALGVSWVMQLILSIPSKKQVTSEGSPPNSNYWMNRYR